MFVKMELSDHTDAYDDASDSSYGCDFLFTLGFNAPDDYDYHASVNQAFQAIF